MGCLIADVMHSERITKKCRHLCEKNDDDRNILNLISFTQFWVPRAITNRLDFLFLKRDRKHYHEDDTDFKVEKF